MKLDAKFGDTFFPVALIHAPGGYKVRLDGADREATLVQLDGPRHQLTLDGQTHEVWLATEGDTVFIHALGKSWKVELLNAIDRAASEREDNDNILRAPMPGVVVDVRVQDSEQVSKGQPLLVIESMKLETLIAAKAAGVVETVHVRMGDTFDKDTPLVTLQEQE